MQRALREDAPVQTATLLNASSPTGSITFPRELALSLWHLLKRAHLSGGGVGERGGGGMAWATPEDTLQED